jgi:hypothetical protein
MPFKKRFSVLVLMIVLPLAWLQAQTQLTNIPTIYIKTFNNAAITSTKTWVSGLLTVLSQDSSDIQLLDSLQIRGRGNSTWTSMPKKSYRLKFNKKRHLLGMDDDAKNWVLLANYADKTLIRNAVAFEIGRYIGMEFTPSVRFADVYLNNVYLGNYLVTDQIEAGKNRVNIDKLTETDVVEPNVSGGYLFQQDGFNYSEDCYFYTNKNLPFSVKEPDSDDMQAEQLTYLKNFINGFESTLFSSTWSNPVTGYRAIIDTASFLNWYIASELTGNIDCFWSTNMFKQRSDPRLHYGPLWDYDIAFNNDKRRNDIVKVRMLTTAFENKTWITQIATDTWFKASVNRRWKEIVNQGIKNHLQTYIDSLVSLIDASQKQNYQTWKTLNTMVYNEWYAYPTYQEYVNVLKTYVNNRVDFLTTSFATDAPIEPTTPFTLESFYYSITNKTSMTRMDVQDLSTADSTRSVLYSPVEGRNSQLWKLVPMTDGSYQIINRYTGRAMRSNAANYSIRSFTPNSSDIRQHWKLVPMNMGGGTYYLVNVSTNNVAENQNGSNVNNTYVREYTKSLAETTNQAWMLEKVEALEAAVDEVHTTLGLRIGPNPASNWLQVHVDGFQQKGRLEIYDLQGTLLLQQNVTSQDAALNVEDLTQGVYLLRFRADQQCTTIKFLVRR